MTPNVEVHADPAALARAARAHFVEIARAAIDARGACDVALAGGSTPRAFYSLLEPHDLDWRAVRFFFGDERCVPPDDPRSNYRMAKETLLDRLSIEPTQVHRMRGELEPQRAADDYEAVLLLLFDAPMPRFDLCWLGLGADGHTASLFPATAALEEREKACVANWVPQLGEWRLTLTLPAIARSRNAIFVVSGKEKAEAVRRVLAATAEAQDLPAARVASVEGSLSWLLDRTAG